MIVPEMIGSIVGVYNGKTFNQVEIKVRFNFIDHHLKSSKVEQLKPLPV